jgi:hypothetical protein
LIGREKVFRPGLEEPKGQRNDEMIEQRTLRLTSNEQRCIGEIAEMAVRCLYVDRDLAERYTGDEEAIRDIQGEMNMLQDVVDSMEFIREFKSGCVTLSILHWRLVHREFLRSMARDWNSWYKKMCISKRLETVTR